MPPAPPRFPEFPRRPGHLSLPRWRPTVPLVSPRTAARLRRLPAWLALLALCLRIALPGLHDHGPQANEATADPHVVAAAPGAASPAADSLQPATADDHGACAACEFELATPGGAVPVPVALPALVRQCTLPLPTPAAPRAPPPQGQHLARAPPSTTAAFPTARASGAPVT